MGPLRRNTALLFSRPSLKILKIAFAVMFAACIAGIPSGHYFIKGFRRRESLSEFELRKKHLREVCSKGGSSLGVNQNRISGVYYGYKPSNLLYCKIPKTGCTYWTRVFQVLNAKNDVEVRRILASPRYVVHASVRASIVVRAREAFVRNATKMIVVRNPYSRLFSAYMDKIFMPEMWISFGRKVVKFARKTPSAKSLGCGHDVSFGEFLRFVSSKRKHLFNTNDHWDPIAEMCSPCAMKYDLILHQESFSRDRDAVLEVLRKRNVDTSGLVFFRSHENYTEHTIGDMVVTMLKYFRGKESCLSFERFLERLWNLFQVQGYIHEQSAFRSDGFRGFGMADDDAIAKRFLKEFRERPVSREQWRLQRREALTAAYRDVGSETLRAVRKKYAADFELFNYGVDPNGIY